MACDLCGLLGRNQLGKEQSSEAAMPVIDD